MGAREEEEEEEEEEARDDYVTGNDVIIRELNSVVEKLEREKSHLQGKDDKTGVWQGETEIV